MNVTGVTWRKSTHSGGQGECLEIADGLPTGSPVPVRDSKRPDGPHLLFPAPAWSAFIASVKAARS
ncbi:MULTISPECIES: DUF397 domain-containing protein [Streptomyces]|uniref:DUF397 domain-containing protein n=2 Tax=Streptomyces rimosus subsp. rimosus TaxID=132474 RepID=L8EUR3_STRR1|nr:MULTISPECIES: DUF397 domain-containing protein [Streptomyces]KOG71892.1 toxin [Kitasatospora aureofaciens]MYT48627.1 DUF397 domain-containing protein [Streptomyces sp. SID5471]KEF06099.1 hypothetical protein DF17_16300 [Streptomyces rimosus]KEF19089.1 hypothetical protein DF18_19740 [Streptomyces rimosus]KOT26714.1 toxin [Streptomyces sp. NRRL WC-3701]